MRVLMAVGVGQDAAVLVVGVVWQVALGAQRAVVAMAAVEIDLRIDVVGGGSDRVHQGGLAVHVLPCVPRAWNIHGSNLEFHQHFFFSFEKN